MATDLQIHYIRDKRHHLDADHSRKSFIQMFCNHDLRQTNEFVRFKVLVEAILQVVLYVDIVRLSKM